MPSRLPGRVAIGAMLSATVSSTALVRATGPMSPARVDQIAAANDNRTPAGSHVGDTLVLRLAVSAVKWGILGGDRGTFRAQVMRDSSIATWRPVAKDGFTLPAAQAILQPSNARVGSGETADFELTPDRPSELALQFGTPARNGTIPVAGSVRLRVVP